MAAHPTAPGRVSANQNRRRWGHDRSPSLTSQVGSLVQQNGYRITRVVGHCKVELPVVIEIAHGNSI
jgi:hypothetical protein